MYEDQYIDIYEEANYLGNQRVSRIITLKIKGIILEIQVRTTPEMFSMINHQLRARKLDK